MYRSIRGTFIPQLVAWDDDPVEPILLIEDLSSHTWPPPWSEHHLDRVLEQIDAMHNTTVAIESYAELHGVIALGWQRVAADPLPFLSLDLADEQWLNSALPHLLDYEARCSTEGTNLCHWDVRSDNICFSANRAIFVDWNWACLSNPRLDLGFWLPNLTYEGGPLPERILPDAPDVAAWVSGFFAASAGLPIIPDAPRVCVVQRQQLETALPWVVRALDLPPLTS